MYQRISSIRGVLNTQIVQCRRHFQTQGPYNMASQLNSENISRIAQKEKEITGSDQPVRGGPTAQAQKHSGQPIDTEALRDITKGETKITGEDGPVRRGPTAEAQSIVGQVSILFLPFKGGLDMGKRSINWRQERQGTTSTNGQSHSGNLDPSTISRINEAESDITGTRQPLAGGPTAQAQRHANESLNSQNLHDITAGEKTITGGERLKGGPTATAQSELGKSRT